MNETTDEPDDAEGHGNALPDVSQMPLLGLVSNGDLVLDAAIRRLIEDVVNQADTTAGFGNIT